MEQNLRVCWSLFSYASLKAGIVCSFHARRKRVRSVRARMSFPLNQPKASFGRWQILTTMLRVQTSDLRRLVLGWWAVRNIVLAAVSWNILQWLVFDSSVWRVKQICKRVDLVRISDQGFGKINERSCHRHEVLVLILIAQWKLQGI